MPADIDLDHFTEDTYKNELTWFDENKINAANPKATEPNFLLFFIILHRCSFLYAI
jgi:hypothetical protein